MKNGQCPALPWGGTFDFIMASLPCQGNVYNVPYRTDYCRKNTCFCVFANNKTLIFASKKLTPKSSKK